MSKAYHLPLLIGGISNASTHLEPCSLRVSSLKVGWELRIHVLYSNHCFSRKFDPGLHPEGTPTFVDGRGERRVFDPTRYGLSLLLPEITQHFAPPQTRVCRPRRGEIGFIRRRSRATSAPYLVFFELRRARRDEGGQDLNLTVESTYPQMDQPAPSLLGPMGFVLLAGKVYRGEPTTTRR